MDALRVVVNGYLNLKYIAILLLFLSPAFYLIHESYPDWGDDFAQYIYQSQHIWKSSSDYKQVLNVSEFSSPKRAIFFSVLLSFVNGGLAIKPYLIFNTFLFLAAAVCVFLFASTYLNHVLSMLVSLVMFYNFLVLRLQQEVLSEFLFIALLYLILYLAQAYYKKLKLFIPLLIALLISVRFVGVVVLVAYVFQILINANQNRKEKLKDVVYVFIINAVTLLLLNSVFVRGAHNEEISLYSNYTQNNISIESVWNNMKIYSQYILFFFEQEIPWYLNKIITILSIVFILIGLIMSFYQKATFTEYVFVGYVLALFIFPNSADTVRYLIPIFPLVIYYLTKGILFPSNFLAQYFQYYFTISFLLILILSNVNTVRLWWLNQKTQLNPYSVSVKEDFVKVKSIVKQNETVAFTKPFLINLFCDRNSYYLTNENCETIIPKVNYLLLAKNSLPEIHAKTSKIKLGVRDTTELNHFFLLKLPH